MIGLKFTDGLREYEIIEQMDINGQEWWRLKNYTENRDKEIMNIEEINGYIARRKELKERFYGVKKYKEESERQRKELVEYNAKIEKEKEENYNNDYGFTDDKTILQKGKILKILNKRIYYHNNMISRKDRIYNTLENNTGAYTKEIMMTNRYSNKKVCLTYRELKDKLEYRLYFQDCYFELTKTEFDYTNYLINKREFLKVV